MLAPESPSPPSPPSASRNGHSLSEIEPSAPLHRGSGSALEPLLLPPRPPTTDEVTRGPAKEVGIEATRPSPPSTTITPHEAALQPRLFLRNLNESVAIIVDHGRNFALDKNVSTTFKVVSFGGATAAVVGSSACGVPWALGALCLVVARAGACLTENRHIRANGAVLGSILSLHFMSLELNAMAASTQAFAGRMILQSMIPESKAILNAVVASAGIALSGYLFCSSPGFIPEASLHNVPLAVTIVGGVASALSDKWSWASRLANLMCSSAMLPYHCMVSGSWFLAALSGVFAYGSAKQILEVDLPKLRDTREDLT